MRWLILVLIVIIFSITEIIRSQKRKHESIIEDYEYEIEDLKNDLKEAKSEITQLEYDNLSDQEKEAICFHEKPDLDISFFKSLKKEQVVKLVQGSYCYPENDIFISEYLYKHDHVDTSPVDGGFGFEVHGSRRYNHDDEWQPCTLLADNRGCSTISCSGTIKLQSS